MRHAHPTVRTLLLAACVAFAAYGSSAAISEEKGRGPRFEISFDAGVSEKPFSGRVFVMLTSRGFGSPRKMSRWTSPDPFFAQDVEDWRPGQTLLLEAAKCLGYPAALGDLPAGEYRVQAVMDLNGWARDVLNGPGNGYSKTQSFEHDPDSPPTVALRITEKVAKPKLNDSADLKYIRLQSRMLSVFHDRDVFLRAAVKFPKSYREEPERRYPTMYIIPGFGGEIGHARMMLSMDGYAAAGIEIVRVFLDPSCPTGHHVFADSANNGPWGTALVEELIPHLEKKFRLIADADARYVNGHSSGGWSSLWLQIAYPDFFGGTWSTSPDPVDFAAFQLVDIYDAKEKYYYDKEGDERPVGRGRMGSLSLKALCDMEAVLGRGGQLQSFEAVFSPRGADGEPLKLWDRKTGELDPRVAQAWRKYDIRLMLEKNWETLGPKLEGKLHLFCGDADTFYLERAFLRLRDTLKKLGSDAHVQVLPGAGHELPRSVNVTIAEQVAEQFQKRYVERHEK